MFPRSIAPRIATAPLISTRAKPIATIAAAAVNIVTGFTVLLIRMLNAAIPANITPKPISPCFIVSTLSAPRIATAPLISNTAIAIRPIAAPAASNVAPLPSLDMIAANAAIPAANAPTAKRPCFKFSTSISPRGLTAETRSLIATAISIRAKAAAPNPLVFCINLATPTISASITVKARILWLSLSVGISAMF